MQQRAAQQCRVEGGQPVKHGRTTARPDVEDVSKKQHVHPRTDRSSRVAESSTRQPAMTVPMIWDRISIILLLGRQVAWQAEEAPCTAPRRSVKKSSDTRLLSSPVALQTASLARTSAIPCQAHYSPHTPIASQVVGLRTSADHTLHDICLPPPHSQSCIRPARTPIPPHRSRPH